MKLTRDAKLREAGVSPIYRLIIVSKANGNEITSEQGTLPVNLAELDRALYYKKRWDNAESMNCRVDIYECESVDSPRGKLIEAG